MVVMQRLHMDDLVGHLLDQRWVHLNLPAIAECQQRIALTQPGIICAGPAACCTRSVNLSPCWMSSSARWADGLQPNISKSRSHRRQSREMGMVQFYDDVPAWIDRPDLLSWDTALSARLASYSACVVLKVRGDGSRDGGLP